MRKYKKAKVPNVERNISWFSFPLWNAPDFGNLPLIGQRNDPGDKCVYDSSQLSWSDASAHPSALDELMQDMKECHELMQISCETSVHGIEKIICEENQEAPIMPCISKTPKTIRKTKKRVSRKSSQFKQPLRRSTRKTRQLSHLSLRRMSGHIDTIFASLGTSEKLKLQEQITEYIDEQSSDKASRRNELDMPSTAAEVEVANKVLETDSTEAVNPPISETPKLKRKSLQLTTPMKNCLKKKLSVTILPISNDQMPYQKNDSVVDGDIPASVKTVDDETNSAPTEKQDQSGLKLALPESEEEFEDMETDLTDQLTKPRKSILGKHKLSISTKVLEGLAAKRRSTRQSLRLKVLANSNNTAQNLNEGTTPNHINAVISEEKDKPLDSSETDSGGAKDKSRSRPKPRIAKPVSKSKKAKPKVTSFLSSGSFTRSRKIPGCGTPVQSNSRFISPMRTPNSGINAMVKSFILRNTPERHNREAELLEKKKRMEEKRKKEEETARRLEEEKRQKMIELKKKREARTLRAVRQREMREKEMKEKQHQKQEQWQQKLVEADRLRIQRINEEAAKMSKHMEKCAKAEAKRKEEDEEKLKRLKDQDEEKYRRYQQQIAEKKLAEERKQREKRQEEDKKKEEGRRQVEEERQKILKLEEQMRIALEEEEAAKQMTQKNIEAEKHKRKLEQEAKRKKQQEKLDKLKEERAKAQAEREQIKQQKLEEKRLAKEKKAAEEQKRKIEERRQLEERIRREQEREEEAAQQLEDALRRAKEEKRALEEEEMRKKLEAAKKREATRARVEENRRMQEERLKQERVQQEMRRKEQEYLRQAQEAEERIKKLQVEKEATSAVSTTNTVAHDKSMLNSTYTKANESVDNYNMTPRGPGRPLLPSTSHDYNIDDLQSEDSTDNEDEPKKIVPRWAKGALLRSAILHQHRFPPNLDLIFPNMLNPVMLDNLFNSSKERYFKRTSSAQWNSPIMPASHISFTKQCQGF